MRLNYDCIRDALLAISELNVVHYVSESECKIYKVPKQQIIEHPLIAGNYSYDDIQYTLIELFEMGFVRGYRSPKDANILRYCDIDNITPAGHEFLDNVTEKNTWEAVKRMAKSFGALSRETLRMAVTYVLSHPEYIKQTTAQMFHQ